MSWTSAQKSSVSSVVSILPDWDMVGEPGALRQATATLISLNAVLHQIQLLTLLTCVRMHIQINLCPMIHPPLCLCIRTHYWMSHTVMPQQPNSHLRRPPSSIPHTGATLEDFTLGTPQFNSIHIRATFLQSIHSYRESHTITVRSYGTVLHQATSGAIRCKRREIDT